MKYLQNYMEDKQTKLFEEVGGFFAFSEEQVVKGLNGRSPKDIVGMPGGFYLNKDMVNTYVDKIDLIWEEGIKEDFEENGAEGIICREFWNHETAYTGDENACLGALEPYIKRYPKDFSKEVIGEVFNKCYLDDINS